MKNLPPINDHQHPVIFNAKYRRSEVPEFMGNPFIDALPAINTQDDWIDQLNSPVAFDVEERKSAAYLRSYYVLRLRSYFQPLPKHLDLAMRVDQVLRQGYVCRSPVNGERTALLQSLYEKEQDGINEYACYSEYQPISSLSLIGTSGIGKSTTTERILSRYPQTIYHPEYGLHQIVWIKIDCPPDGSVIQLAINFIVELDRLLQTNFRSGISARMGKDGLLETVKHLAGVYSIGLIAIDEIQNLSIKKSGGRESMMNFFQEMCNVLHVPIMLMGTMKAMRILQLDFRQARRNAAVGSYVWEAMRNDSSWEFLLDSFWRYQWLHKPVDLTKKWRDFLYKETQGIVAVVSAAFILAQLRALRKNEEEITEELFKRVMQKDLAPIQPMLKALRSGDSRRIARYEDIIPLNFDELMDREQQKIIEGKLKSAVKKGAVTSCIESNAIMALEMMGYDNISVTKAVSLAVSSGAKTQAAIVRYVLDVFTKGDETDPEEDMNGDMDLRAYSSEENTEKLRREGLIKGI